MSSSLPNQSLLNLLINRYYTADAQADANLQKENGGPYISSHWRSHGDLFKIETGPRGELISLSGSGFGSCRWKNPVHKLIDQACILSHLLHLHHRASIVRLRAVAARICRDMGLDPTFDVFRQVFSFDLLQRYISPEMRRRRLFFLMIGDGYGVLSAIFKEMLPDSTIVMLDIGKTLLFQAYYCQKAHPLCVHKIAGEANLDAVDFLYCPVEDLEKIERYRFDIAVNIASMQEMSNATVARYYHFLRRNLRPDNLFYCCNREYKRSPGGEVSEFRKYPWMPGDRFFVDGICPWHQYFFSVGRAERGLTLFKVRIPFVNFYDGIHLHRLAVLQTI